MSAFLKITSLLVDNVESKAAVEKQENGKCHPHLHSVSKCFQIVPAQIRAKKKLLLSLDFPLCLPWSPGHYLARLFEVRPPHRYQEVTERHGSDNK